MNGALSPTDIGVAGIFIILVLKEVGNLIDKKRNGKPDDSTKEYKILHPCKDDPRWVTHISDTHSTCEAAMRIENNQRDLAKGINQLVVEATKQTSLLKEIAKNGN